MEAPVGKYAEIVEDFYEERTRILGALDQEENRHVLLRLVGALAFRTQCPKYGYIQDELGRQFTDFDFASYPRFVRDIRRILTELGYDEDKQVTQLFGERRMLFHDPAFGRHIDVFFNALDFCHVLSFEGRLEAQTLTLPLAELLLEKMQIVQINEKDIIDTIMLLLEHPLGSGDHETINIQRVAQLCAADWGLWRTTTMNLNKVRILSQGYAELTADQKAAVESQVNAAMRRIDEAPKTMAWRLRARVGDRVKWYKDVDEVQ
jgi:hypothetical protein